MYSNKLRQDRKNISILRFLHTLPLVYVFKIMEMALLLKLLILCMVPWLRRVGEPMLIRRGEICWRCCSQDVMMRDILKIQFWSIWNTYHLSIYSRSWLQMMGWWLIIYGLIGVTMFKLVQFKIWKQTSYNSRLAK